MNINENNIQEWKNSREEQNQTETNKNHQDTNQIPDRVKKHNPKILSLKIQSTLKIH